MLEETRLRSRSIRIESISKILMLKNAHLAEENASVFDGADAEGNDDQLIGTIEGNQILRMLMRIEDATHRRRLINVISAIAARYRGPRGVLLSAP